MERDIKKLISEMTLEEKVSLCSGKDFWYTRDIERLGIPAIMMADGPHGLRKQEGASDHMGLNKSIPATCFPSAAGLACSWDKEIAKKVGIALGEEAQAEGVSILLGPGVNIKRSPLCGRNFEYFSEDPFLSSKMATSFIKGVQSQGVGTSLKHFAVNNQEHRRMSIDAIVDERTLREIYLASFEEPVKQGKPWTVMAAYNKVNGDFCSENNRLLTEILRDEWGFEDFVVSDWGAVVDRDRGVEAGMDVEMPNSGGIGDKKLLEAVKSGKLDERIIDRALERVLKVVFRAIENKKVNSVYSKEIHHDIAREVARESMVLLKNEDNILPLKRIESIAVIGAFAKKPRYQGGGSSHINPTKIDNIYEELEKLAGSNAKLTYSEGYDLVSDEIDKELINDAKEAAKNAKVAVIFVGLPDRYESEGFDRKHLRIPDNHIKLIEAVAEVQSNIVVVLSNGAPIEMPWLGKVKAVLEGYLGGQALGGAIADLLFGVVSPSGKLAETFPKKLCHNPSYLNFPGDDEKVEYKEGVFVGYRHYDTRDIEPLFPFGYGLSYSSFEYSDIKLDKKSITDEQTVTVTVKVKNTGDIEAKEIVQLYVKDVESSISRPEKELKGFEKVSLKPGEEKTVVFTLDKRAFAYYNVNLKDWHVETGSFEILVGKSSRHIVLRETLEVQSTVNLKKVLTKHSTFGDLMEHPIGAQVMQAMTPASSVDASASLDGLGTDPQEMMKGTVLRAAVAMSNGSFTEEMLQGILQAVNGSN
ncbi:glycoside hydrolase family 3 C-terminal domain-containing protein [Clostridium fungisolvens]|uniref:Thermostable beta-glucosidase B n=1 Tax=Clostridium fungisolvens TaxID=1604897 RepID=A0A6V8SBR8_9CLOT|nr:glycoside hydrolase family 3 C-terminal domain-containing protein [Clostridium fungisolvens]GFP74684.1 Thermostable beta-glucosidase B [Clostridium fungisolvens]